jgi:hypothetical protein
MYLPTAKLLSNILSRYKYDKIDGISLGDTVFEKNAWREDCLYYPKGNSLFSENEKPRQLTFKCILQNNEKVGHLKLSSGSPFLCLSNSWFGYPTMQDQGASLPHYLSYYLQHMVDWKYQSGMGNERLRNLLSDRYLLNNRKVVLLAGEGETFGSIQSIPKYLVDNAEQLVLIKTISIDDIRKQNNDTFEAQIQDEVSMISAKQDRIRFNIEIPSMPNYRSCMSRINIPVALSYSSSRVAVFDSNDDKELDSTSFVIGNNLKCDLFVPASGEQQKMSIVITPRSKGFYFGIKNVELWGF